MEIQYISLISALVGALIGSISSIATIFVSSYFENKRQLVRLAYEAAISDHKIACDISLQESGPMLVSPLTSYVHFHVEYMKLLEKGTVSEKELNKLRESRDKLWPSSDGS